MKHIRLIIIFVAVSIAISVKSQDTSADVSFKLEKMFTQLRDNLNSAEKLIINDSVRLIIENYATSDTVYNHRFSNFRFLGQITSPDSLVKIITWNLILPDGVNRYYCYLIRRKDFNTGSKVYKISGLYNEAPVRSDTIYSLSDWYGALYYDIRPFVFNKEINYAILGIDYGNSFITRKIIDVLSFNSSDEIEFGKNCFADGKEIKSRVVFEFASTAVMTLRFITDTSIVFDHLSPFSPELKNNHQFYGPDFSYDAYNFENGLWRFKSDVDIRNKE